MEIFDHPAEKCELCCAEIFLQWTWHLFVLQFSLFLKQVLFAQYPSPMPWPCQIFSHKNISANPGGSHTTQTKVPWPRNVHFGENLIETDYDWS